MSHELYYIVFMYKYYQVNLFLILIEKVDQKLNFQHCLAWTQPYKSQIWPKRGENKIFKCQKWYCPILYTKPTDLPCFLLYLGSLTKSQNFIPDWPKRSYESWIGSKGEENMVLKIRELYNIILSINTAN